MGFIVLVHRKGGTKERGMYSADWECEEEFTIAQLTEKISREIVVWELMEEIVVNEKL